MEEIIKRTCWTLIFLSFAVSIACGASQDAIVLPDEAVTKKTLDNGLTILAKYAPPQGLVAIDVKVKAGSSVEGEYLGSGISHLVEHMIFKGTASRAAGVIEKEIKSYGGILNGSASSDDTDFYIVLPSKYLPQALAILKDMLSNAKMNPAVVAGEKEIILKEMRMYKDEPQGRLMRTLNSKAYLEHTYKFPVIGYEDNLNELTAADLMKYYKTRYVPNRMIVTVVGGIDESDAIQQVEKEFNDFRRADYSISDVMPVEPTQIQHRRADEYMDTSLAYLAMGFHSTGLLNEDLFAMDVLSVILGRGDNSRLNTALYKDKSLVHTIAAWNYTPRDPGLFVVTAVLDKDNLDEAEKSVMEELARAREGFTSDSELDSAKRILLADLISALGTIQGQANDISASYALTGSEGFSRRYIEGVRGVTKEDIKAVSGKYLRADNLTTVRILPRAACEPKKVVDRPKEENVVAREVLPNGLKLFVREDKKIPSVTITAAMLGALAVETKENNGISNITADMMLRGTQDRPDSGKIKGVLQELGGEIYAFSGANTFGISISVLKPDVEIALEILKDVLVNANFSENEFEKSRAFIAASIRAEDDDIFEVGFSALKKELFEGSPYGLRNIGRIRSVSSLKPKDASAFYKKYCLPNNMAIAVSGDVEPVKMMARLKELFSGLKKRELFMSPVSDAAINKPKAVTITMDKEQSLFVLGFKTVPRKSPDKYALEALGAVMSGHSGRLFSELRSKYSLAYTLGCWQDYWTDTGIFAFYVATTKEKLADAKRALIKEIRKIKTSGVTDEELRMAKSELVSSRQMAMQSNEFYTFNFAVEELRGLGYDNLYKYETAIDSVTKEDVVRAADKYFDLAKSVEVTVSPK
ncbi:MAG: insulinase family protein [Candidatus Omnitrophica bacterium]|nr:insulinase family protein [Candidatus Omnitrophota bacterium]MBU1809463.1 insulinase family protein [Candidatus Omnitrophota bacterium]